LDSLILGIPGSIIFGIVQANVPTEIVACSGGLCEQPTGGGFAILGLASLASLAVGVWYYAEFDGRRGQTVGKSALGVRVVDIATNEPIGGGRGVGRYFAKWLSALPCGLGYLWMLWDNERQTWHDKMVRSIVIVDR
jgi:uncharacterized RDD family membrane protein YckC